MSSRMSTSQEIYNSSAKVVLAEWEGDKPGLNGAIIKIKFDHNPFRYRDCISYDVRGGTYLYVDGSTEEWVYCKVLTSEIKTDWMPQNHLESGCVYYIATHLQEPFGITH